MIRKDFLTLGFFLLILPAVFGQDESRLKDPDWPVIDSFMHQGLRYMEKGEQNLSNYYFEEALKIADRKKYPRVFSAAYSNMGANYFTDGDYNNAMRYYNMAIEIDLEIKNYKNVTVELANIGLAQSELKRFDLAREAFLEALAISRKSPQYPKTLTGIYVNLASLYHELQKPDSSRYYCLLGLEEASKANDTLNMAYLYNNLGGIKNTQKEPDSALFFFFRALDFYKAIDHKPELSRIYANISSVYIDQKDYKTARYYTQQSYATLLYARRSSCVPCVYENIVSYYEGVGQFDSALYYHRKARKYDDSMHTVLLNDSLQRYRVKSEIAVKNLQIANLESERKVVWLRVGIIVTGLVFIGMIFLFIYRRKLILARHEKELAEMELERKEEIIHVREKELVDYITLLSGKNRQIENLNHELEQARAQETINGVPEEDHQELYTLKILTEEDWTLYKKKFSAIYPAFFTRLKQLPQPLTEAEQRLLALLKLRLKSKEIAEILGISDQSVRVAKLRLKRKLQSLGEDSLEAFMDRIVLGSAAETG